MEDEFDEKKPREQAAHVSELFAPTAVEYCPGPHRPHPDGLCRPEPDAYDPAKHAAHALMLVAPTKVEYVPDPHTRQPDGDARPRLDE